MSQKNKVKQADPKRYLMIDNRDCLACKHLLPCLKVKEFSECHYTNGNEKCPAQHVQIIRHIDIDGMVTKMYDALYDDDQVTFGQLKEEVETYQPEYVYRIVTDRLQAKLDAYQQQ